eukprot:1161532-Pelagomonas_calceolata.AAC.6
MHHLPLAKGGGDQCYACTSVCVHACAPAAQPCWDPQAPAGGHPPAQRRPSHHTLRASAVACPALALRNSAPRSQTWLALSACALALQKTGQ